MTRPPKKFGEIAGVMDNGNTLVVRMGEYIEISSEGYTIPLDRSQMWRVKELYEDGDPRVVIYYGDWKRQPILKNAAKLPADAIASCNRLSDDWLRESWRAAFIWCQSKSINIPVLLTQCGIPVRRVRDLMELSSIATEQNLRLRYFLFLKMINVEYFSLVSWYMGRKMSDPAWCDRLMASAFQSIAKKQTSDGKSTNRSSSIGSKISDGRKKARKQDQVEQHYAQLEVPKELVAPVEPDRSGDADILKSWENE